MEKLPALCMEQGLAVETFDALYGNYMLADDIAFYIEQASQTGGPIMEAGPGTGRVAWPLAEAGYLVTGLELSKAMMEIAESKRSAYPDEVGDRIKFALGDMRDFRLDGAFSLAIIAFRTFQANTTPEDQRRCLLRIHRHLRPGGRLIIQLFDPRLDMLLPDAPRELDIQEVKHPKTGNMVRIRAVDHVNNLVAQTFSERWIHEEIDDKGVVIRKDEEILNMGWIYRREMQYLFELTGFEVLAEYSDFKKSPPAYGKEQIWVARKA
jgi:SAM-dependent methyltransferase